MNVQDIPDKDLKFLADKFIGECDGIYYFRDGRNPNGPAYRGDYPDLKEHLLMRALYPEVTAEIAAYEQARRLKVPAFGSKPGDKVAS